MTLKTTIMIEFLSLPEERRRQYIRQVNIETGMSEKAVEKDWWVTLVLKAIFALPMSQHFVFKQLKKEGASFTSSVIATELYAQLRRMGVAEELFSISVEMIRSKLPDKDPQTVFVRYVSLYEPNTYVADEVEVEFGVRSLKEPFDEVSILSTIGTHIRVATYTEYKLVTEERFFRLEFDHNARLIFYLQYSFGFQLFKRAAPAQLDIPNEWVLDFDWSDIN